MSEIKTILINRGPAGTAGATTFSALTDKTTVDLPAINTPLANALALKAPRASPTFTGTVTAGEIQTTGVTALIQTFGDNAAIKTSGASAYISTEGANAHIQTTGVTSHIQTTGVTSLIQTTGESSLIQTLGDNAAIITQGESALIATSGANAHIKTFGANADIQTTNGQFIGAGTGLTGTASSLTAGTVTTIGNLTGVVTSTNRATSIANGAITNAMLANGAVANLSGTNTGDNAANSLYSGIVTNATHTGDATGSGALTVRGINGVLMSGLATGITKNTTSTGVPSIAVAADFPTLNQSTTGNAGTATAALGLKTATTTVSVDSATAPTAGQVLTATSGTAGNWQTPASATAEIENWVFEGDSWTQDYTPANQKTWPYYIAKIARKGISFNNVATAGQSALQMVSTFSSQVTPLLTTASGRKSLLFLFAGINDVYGNDAAAVLAVRDNLRSMWTTARSNGALVCAFTLPHRLDGNGGWTQANLRAVNAQIIADSSYYDFIVRTDIVFSNANTSEYTDGIHTTTAAHQKLASQIYRAINGIPATPSLWPRAAFYACNGGTLTANTPNYMGFQSSLFFDDNNDISNVTSGGFDIKTFTVPVDGTYAVNGNFLAANTTGATLILSAYVTPLATGTPEEYRLQYVISTATFYSIAGTTGPIKLKLGDTIKIAVNPSIAGVACLPNSRMSLFSVNLISIP